VRVQSASSITLFERLALHELHREVHLPRRVEAELVHRHDAGVVELARDLRLLLSVGWRKLGLISVGQAPGA
jgi:hypothetical protein